MTKTLSRLPILMALMIAIAGPAFAQFDPKIKPKMIARPGRAPLWDLTLEPGKPRIAEPQVSVSPVKTITSSFVVTETECGRTRPRCEAFVDMRVIRAELKWKEHPDPDKVGKTVKLGQNDAILVTRIHDIVPQEGPAFAGIGAARLKCEDWDWLPPSTASSGRWDVLRWEVEVNVTNPESGRTENVSFGGVHDIAFALNGAEATTLSRGPAIAQFGLRAPFLEGTNFLFMDDGRGNGCQVSVQASDTDRVSAQIRALAGEVVPQPDASDVLYDQFIGFEQRISRQIVNLPSGVFQ